MATPDEIAATQKILGEPYLAEFNDDALKVRRNLLVISLVAIVGHFYGVTIAPDSPVFGLHLLNISDQAIRTGLIVSIIYLFVHFVWYTLDSFAAWRVRVTGTRQAQFTKGSFISEKLDPSNDERQSTLYNWWRVWGRGVSNVEARMISVETSISDLGVQLAEMQAINAVQNTGNVAQGINEIQKRIIELKESLSKTLELATSPRIEASLARFDNWFMFWVRSQNLRWLIIDVGAPISMGLLAIVLLLHPEPKILRSPVPHSPQISIQRACPLATCGTQNAMPTSTKSIR